MKRRLNVFFAALLPVAFSAPFASAAALTPLQSKLKTVFGPSLDSYTLYPAPRTDHGIGYAYIDVEGTSVPICDTILPDPDAVPGGAMVIPNTTVASNVDIDAGLNLVNGLVANIANVSASLKAQGYNNVTVTLNHPQEYVIPATSLLGGPIPHVSISSSCKAALQALTLPGSTKLSQPVYLVFKAISVDGLTLTLSSGIGAPPAGGAGGGGAPPAGGAGGGAAPASEGAGAEIISLISGVISPNGSAAPPAGASGPAASTPATKAVAAGGASAPTSTNPNCTGVGASASGHVLTANVNGSFCVVSGSDLNASTSTKVWVAYHLITVTDIKQVN